MSQLTPEVRFQLTDIERRFLLSLARRSLEAAVRREPRPAPPEIPSGLEARLRAFVSLHKKDVLCGCIGYVQATLPLYRTVMDAAEAAALRDSRFPPLQPPELPGVEIEISVLSVFRAVRPDEIEVGAHGLMITQDRARGLLLPQVAVARQMGSRPVFGRGVPQGGTSPGRLAARGNH